MFAVIFNDVGKCCLTGTLKAAEIISPVHSEAQFAEESHVPTVPGAGWVLVLVPVQCRTVSCWAGAVGAGSPGSCWQGQRWEWEGRGPYEPWLSGRCAGGQTAIARVCL